MGTPTNHRWELSVLHYHEIMVIYPYPSFLVITQLFSWIIFINDCIYINWSAWIIFIRDYIFYTNNGEWWEFYRFSQHNSKLPLPRWKQGNYPVIPIYDTNRLYHWEKTCNDWVYQPTCGWVEISSGEKKCLDERYWAGERLVKRLAAWTASEEVLKVM